MIRLRHWLGLASLLVVSGPLSATMAPSAFLTVIWVSGEEETAGLRAAFPGAVLVERDLGRSAGAPRTNPISAIRSDRPGEQAPQSGPLGAIFFVPVGDLLGLPAAPAPTASPAP